MKRLFVIVILLMFSGELHAQRHEFNYTYKLWQDSAPTLTLDEAVNLLEKPELYNSADFQRKLKKSLDSENEEDQKIANLARQIDEYNKGSIESADTVIEVLKSLNEQYMFSGVASISRQIFESTKLELEKITSRISEINTVVVTPEMLELETILLEALESLDRK